MTRHSEPSAAPPRLPLSRPGVAGLTALCVFALLATSMSRGLSLFDSPELALVAHELGLGHPFGQPLHTMAAFLLSRLPGVSPLVGINLLSALSAALCVLPALSLAEGQARRWGAEPETAAYPGRGPWLAALTVGLGALHLGVWESATRIEVYATASLLALWSLALLDSRLDSPQQGRALFWAGILLGLSASANPIVAALAALCMGPALLLRLLDRRLKLRRLLGAVGGGVLGLLPYGYVFITARRAHVFAWGRPLDGPSIHHYFTFADFAQNNSLTADMWLAHTLDWLQYAASQGTLALVFAGCAAGWLASGKGGLGGWLATLAYAGGTLFVATNVRWHLDNPDLHAYLTVPLWLALSGLAAVAIRYSRRAGPAAPALVALLVMLAAPNPLVRTRHRDRFVDDQAAMVLAQAPRNAILLVQTDHLGGALLYLQRVQGLRPDVAVLIHGLASSSWYWQLLYNQQAHLPAQQPGQPKSTLNPVALRGPGGRLGRVQRFVAANPQRPLLVERHELASQLGAPLCRQGWLLGVGPLCRAGAQPSPQPDGLMARSLAKLRDGSPGTPGLIAMVSLERGQALWRMGQPKAALLAFRAGVPPHLLPPLPPPSAPQATALASAPPLAGPMPRWRRPAALGDPARNLFMAAQLLRAGAAEPAYRAHLAAAAALGLPEAALPGAPSDRTPRAP